MSRVAEMIEESFSMRKHGTVLAGEHHISNSSPCLHTSPLPHVQCAFLVAVPKLTCIDRLASQAAEAARRL